MKETDWAKIETPDSWTPDTPLEVKITLKGTVPAGQQICSHLQWMKKAGWGGLLSWVPGKAAESGKTYVFKHKPKMKDGLDRINCLCFLAPDGDFKKKTKSDNVGVPLPGGKLPGEKPASSKPDTVTFKKSYIWLEEPPKPAKGASFGCNLVLIDADEGAGRGRMVWGADLGETASGCGVVTLLP